MPPRSGATGGSPADPTRRALPQGFPVRFQKAVFNSEADESVACSPAIWANNVAFRALNRFWNFLARQVAVALKVHPFG
jgi:hypothetical protein